jgi:hypothetical protein
VGWLGGTNERSMSKCKNMYKDCKEINEKRRHKLSETETRL